VSTVERVYSALITRSDEVEDDLPEEQRADVARNGFRLVLASTLQFSGDQTVKASTVLPWLFHALGVPAALTGLLVPIRESGSMLPQAFLTPLILRFRRRKWVFITGALIQALAVAVMAATAALGTGLAAGVVILAALTVFSLGRALGSITSKDIQGRTLPKGERGQINGLSTTASGLVVIILGLTILYFGSGDLTGPEIAWLLAGGAVLWVGVAAVYAGIREPIDEAAARNEPRSETDAGNWFTRMYTLLSDDHDFRHFVVVRSLLLASALSPPFIVALAAQSGPDTLSDLGGYILASGIAALLGGRLFGRWADRSSKNLMTVGAAVASATIIAFVAVVTLSGDFDDALWHSLVFVGAYFVLTLIHTGVRVGRKTYVIDMAEGDLRTTYVAVSNSAMGLILLFTGVVSSGLATFGEIWALLFLAALGLVGTFASARLPGVSAG
jgi:MFS family permease